MTTSEPFLLCKLTKVIENLCHCQKHDPNINSQKPQPQTSKPENVISSFPGVFYFHYQFKTSVPIYYENALVPQMCHQDDLFTVRLHR